MAHLLRQDPYGCAMHAPIDNLDEANTEYLTKLFRPIMFGQPLTSDALALLPKPYRIVGERGKPVPDIFGEITGPWHVNDKVKAIIEQLEPGLHSFIPIQPIKVDIRGDQEPMRPTDQNYFLLHTQRVVKAVVLEETDFERGRSAESVRASSSGTISALGKCTLDAGMIEGCHLWRGGVAQYGVPGELFWAHYFASDELVSRLKTLGAKGWRYQHCVSK